MDIVKILAVTETDVISILGRVVSESPLKIKLSPNCSDILQSTKNLKLQWFEQDKIYEADLTVLSSENENTFIFQKTSEITNAYERNFYRVDYKGFYKILPLNENNKHEIERLRLHKTDTIKGAFANKIRQLLINDRVSEKYVLQYLLEIDGKIDKLTELLDKKNNSVENMIIVHAIDISGGGVSFFSTEKFSLNQLMYMEGKLDDVINKVEFVAFIKITGITETSKGHIYSAVFTNIDSDFSENIIKYVFEKERKLIQDFKKK